MTSKIITYQELEKAVRIAFEGDKEIYKMYDKNVIVNNIDELVSDIMQKLKDYPAKFPDTTFRVVVVKNEIIGYFVYMENRLISFGLNVAYRKPTYLKKFFEVIQKQFENRFFCSLWSRNIRAVKYLIKNGMQIIDTNPHITTLAK